MWRLLLAEPGSAIWAIKWQASRAGVFALVGGSAPVGLREVLIVAILVSEWRCHLGVSAGFVSGEANLHFMHG